MNNEFHFFNIEIINIYDIMAFCIQYIRKREPGYDYPNIRWEQYIGDVYEMICTYLKRKEETYDNEVLVELQHKIEKFVKFGNVNSKDISDKLFAIIIGIDDLIKSPDLKDNLRRFTFTEYSSLNTQFTDKIRIIPKHLNSFWDRIQTVRVGEHPPFRKDRDFDEGEIGTFLKEYKVIVDDFNEYPFDIYRAECEGEFEEEYSKKEKLLIGIAPVCCNNINDILEIKCEGRQFNVFGMKKVLEDIFIERYRKIINKAINNKLDILMFPEMLMSEKVLEEIKNLRDGNDSMLIVAGSIWYDRKNISYILDNYGDNILAYYKKNPFLYENQYYEDLNPELNKHFKIIEIKGFGRIGIGICKDLLKQSVKDFNKKIGANIILFPAYSKSDDLKSEARELSEQAGSIIVFANTCSALDKDKKTKDVGFLSFPYKNQNGKRDARFWDYNGSNCNGSCEECDEIKKFEINLKDLKSQNNEVEFKVDYLSI